MATELARYAFSVEEWHRMGEAGLFDEDARVELLEGEVAKMAPIGARHFASVTRLGRLLQAGVAERAIVSIQSPVVLDDHSEPRPDVALLSPRSDDYESGRASGTTWPGDRRRRHPGQSRSLAELPGGRRRANRNMN